MTAGARRRLQSELVSGEHRELSEEQEHLERTVEAFVQALAELRSRHSTGGIDEFANEALERSPAGDQLARACG